ncbi:MAG: hypothetical protein GY903_11175 [Fuerstiella sp.]|nr:hypothetical protein [Fuerstiella sp.]MCP4855043.1 hypothetical protein [Fuerstiella sp.]
MKHETKKRNALVLLFGGLIAVSYSLQLSDGHFHEAIPALVLVVGSFMVIAGGAIHIKTISLLEKEIAELQKRNNTQPHENSTG